MTNEAVAARLRAARQAAGYSSAVAAANELGIPYPTVAGHENGSRGLGRSALDYARRYSVSLDWLLNGVGEGPQVALPKADLRNEIRLAVEEGRTSYKALSNAINKNHAYVQQFVERGTPRELRDHDALVIREVIGSPVPLSHVPQTALKGFRLNMIPGEQLVGATKDLPVFVGAQGGDGHLVVTPDPVEYRKRPGPLEDVPNGYGLLIHGESMVPAYRPGQIALVNPNLPPARDEDVILFHLHADENREVIIKHLVAFNAREWRLEQYNPAKDFTELRADWPICHRVVGRYNTR
ncbi:MAG TPA: S24 family peptidase [Tianweitania sediminis]|jgi:phage repressor protein C with HTH and peptisase S24 domain|nr:S24 family peptidase [Tianweitania sediminis]